MEPERGEVERGERSRMTGVSHVTFEWCVVTLRLPMCIDAPYPHFWHMSLSMSMGMAYATRTWKWTHGHTRTRRHTAPRPRRERERICVVVVIGGDDPRPFARAVDSPCGVGVPRGQSALWKVTCETWFWSHSQFRAWLERFVN